MAGAHKCDNGCVHADREASGGGNSHRSSPDPATGEPGCAALAVRPRPLATSRPGLPRPHVYREADALDPVEVIKACHAYQHLCSSAPGWSGSTAHRLVAAIATAATHRLSGYAQAPWIWTRPQIRAGRPVALGRQWRPDLPGISWVDVAELTEAWQSASLIVVTTEAAADLPGGLPARGGLFLLANSDPPDQVWDAVAAVSPEAVLYWPVCDPWLADQVRDPSSQFTHHRDGGPA